MNDSLLIDVQKFDDLFRHLYSRPPNDTERLSYFVGRIDEIKEKLNMKMLTKRII